MGKLWARGYYKYYQHHTEQLEFFAKERKKPN